MEARFNEVNGVIDTAVGYEGGSLEHPTYKDVCTDRTGHAEVVQVEFDPSKVSYDDLLQVFWDNHDPTTLNRQGPDVGTQYRSAVFYHSPEQKQIAEEVIAAVTKEKFYVNPIVTEITPAGTWYEAESYHQEYFARNPFQGYCTAVIEPKVVKFRKQFVSNLKT